MTEWEKQEQERQAWLDGLKVGDGFAVRQSRGYNGMPFVLGTITFITKSRARFDLAIDHGLKKVNADGYESRKAGSYYARSFIEPITEEVLKIIKGHQLNDRLGKLVMDKEGRRVRADLTHDQIERIISILEEHPQ